MERMEELKRKQDELKKQLEMLEDQMTGESKDQDYKKKRKKARLIYEKANYPQTVRSTDAEQNADYKFIYD